MNCRLAQWKDPKISGVPGLLWKDSKFQILQDYFSCCEGKGLRWDSVNEFARSCKLQNHKRKVDAIVNNFNELWPQTEFPLELSSEDSVFFLQWLKGLPHTSGYLQTCKRDGAKPSSFWYFALLTSWRFGVPVHVFSMGRSKDKDVIPNIPVNEYPIVYFLDNVNELWKPKYKEQISAIINWCEQSEVPLWMELREAPLVSQSEAWDVKEAFRSYLSKVKSRPLLDWLDADCLSRLHRVSVAKV